MWQITEKIHDVIYIWVEYLVALDMEVELCSRSEVDTVQLSFSIGIVEHNLLHSEELPSKLNDWQFFCNGEAD